MRFPVAQSKSIRFQKPGMAERGHRMDGWPLPAMLYARPEILSSQILFRLYISPLEETIKQGPPCMYKCMQNNHITQMHTLKIL